MAAVATNTFSGDLFSASDTVSGIPIGAAFPGRVVVIGVIGDASGGVTINGVVASIVDASNVAFASAVVPTGTTATIVVRGRGPQRFSARGRSRVSRSPLRETAASLLMAVGVSP
jgi:hypothetical protein